MWFIKLRASAEMCGVCAGVRRCAQVYTGVRGWTRVCVGVCMRVRAGVRGYGWEGADVRGCVHVWGMNFQNFFWRIESLHQRTLIRILYEFFQFRIYVRPCFLKNFNVSINFVHEVVIMGMAPETWNNNFIQKVYWSKVPSL